MSQKMLPSPSEGLCPMSECHWEKVDHNSPGIDGLVHQSPVALSVVFGNGNRNPFSAVHVILCCSRSVYDKKWKDWRIWDLGLSVKTAEGVHFTDDINNTQVYLGNFSPLNGATLPKCTVVFEMIDHPASSLHPVWFGSTLRASQDLRVAQQNSACVLFDRELPLLPDINTVTLYFIAHFTGTRILVDLPRKPQPLARHFVEILPLITHRQILYKELPVEILLQIFQYIAETQESRGWRRDLLSSALVCRQWICSLDFLLWDLHIPSSHYCVTRPLDVHVLAKVVTEQPVLARSVNHLSTEYFRRSTSSLDDNSASLSSFTSSLITILRSTKNLRTLELKHFDASQMETLGNVLRDHLTLRTFRTGYANRDGAISIVQLAYCLASWPSLKSLAIHGLQRPVLTEPLTALRLPACSLTELYLEGVSVTNAELIYFTSSSLKTLEKITLDRINISDAALRAFLEAISQNVSDLSLRNVGRMRGTDERPLDAMIVYMPRLRTLFVQGNVATELMVSRRANLFSLRDGASLSILHLTFEMVPGLPATIADGKWPGWDIKRPRVMRCPIMICETRLPL